MGWQSKTFFEFSMAAIIITRKEHGQWGLEDKDLFLIPMVAIGITGKEHGEWGLPVKM